MLQRVKQWLEKVTGKKRPEPDNSRYEIPEEELNPCCNQPRVHIAYRGKVDDRLYLAENRTWEETRYFSQTGLRVFCVVCRRRLF